MNALRLGTIDRVCSFRLETLQCPSMLPCLCIATVSTKDIRRPLMPSLYSELGRVVFTCAVVARLQYESYGHICIGQDGICSSKSCEETVNQIYFPTCFDRYYKLIIQPVNDERCCTTDTAERFRDTVHVLIKNKNISTVDLTFGKPRATVLHQLKHYTVLK